MMTKQVTNAGKLIFSILLCELVGVIGSLLTFKAIPTWYAGLVKPALNPPSWLFGPVWTVLYALMGIAAFLVWKQGWPRKEVKIALGIFGVQLVVNGIWSILFFGLHSPLLALVDILLLLVLILVTLVLFYRVSKPSAYLLVPYLCWVSFATYLNYMIYVLN
jgi:tryptophan-rich sensory protein